MRGSVLWEKHSWIEIKKKLEKGAPVLLPMGCLEEHGPHLPVGTDLFQAYNVSINVARRVEGLVLPPFHYGHSSSTRNFPGSLVISADTLRSLTRDVITGVIRSGGKFILINTGHAGSTHMSTIKDTLREIAEENPDVKIFFLTDYEIAEKLAAGDERFPENDGHAGDIETSRMMDINEELVSDPPKPYFPDFPPHRVLSDPEKYFPEGVMGDPTDATREKGRYINEKIEDYLVNLIEREMD